MRAHFFPIWILSLLGLNTRNFRSDRYEPIRNPWEGLT